jgi:hypothetical protein
MSNVSNFDQSDSRNTLTKSSFRIRQSFLAIYVFIVIAGVILPSSDGLRFHIRPNSKKCLKEEIHKDVPVTGEYELSEAPGQKSSITITDTKGHTLFSKVDATNGKFAFTTEAYDVFEICIDNKISSGNHGPEREVFLELKRGVETKNYEALAQAEKLKPLEVELRRLEDLSESIVNDFAYMKAREEEMRDTNESTNSRVLLLSLLSMTVLITLAVWQVLYLRHYFKSKKLID